MPYTTSIVKNGVKVQSITILGKECAVADEVRVQNCVCLPYKELKRVCRLKPVPIRTLTYAQDVSNEVIM